MPSRELYKGADIAAEAAVDLLTEYVNSIIGVPQDHKDDPETYWTNRLTLAM